MSHRIWFPLFAYFLSLNQVLCDAEYKATFTAGAESCSNFKNDIFVADNMELAQEDSEDEDAAGIMCIEGFIELHSDLDEGILFNVEIEKDTDAGSEPMMTTAMDLCQCISDKDAPWAPIFEALGMDSCPVKKGKYQVNDLKVPMDFAKDVLCHEYVGEYIAKVKLTDTQRNVISCHDLGLCVFQAYNENPPKMIYEKYKY